MRSILSELWSLFAGVFIYVSIILVSVPIVIMGMFILIKWVTYCINYLS